MGSGGRAAAVGDGRGVGWGVTRAGGGEGALAGETPTAGPGVARAGLGTLEGTAAGAAGSVASTLAVCTAVEGVGVAPGTVITSSAMIGCGRGVAGTAAAREGLGVGSAMGEALGLGRDLNKRPTTRTPATMISNGTMTSAGSSSRRAAGGPAETGAGCAGKTTGAGSLCVCWRATRTSAGGPGGGTTIFGIRPVAGR